ncbi:phosphoethanolamine transferase [Bacteroides faecis]|uniref:Phosphoethanolamine transferase n=1 Tax=Bacteroides faecis TaxID=674529 RepID=A0ABY5T3G0_9BACE|nr:phosphoethanolamine transferase [Bacteroides faecis]UVQ72200.1 phosphoethanolamine transferase [Bacteroides faecis]
MVIKKNTNPLLGKRNQNGELYVFDNVVSPATTTIPSFKYMMSTYNYQSKMQWYKEQTLAQIIKESGYTSYWFSNQGKYGFWNNVIVKYAKLFDESFFCDELYTENNEIKYDEEVLALREKFEIKDRIPKFIVYHLMGSHPDFRLRSPQNFKLFDCDDYVCNNDCYNSQVLAEYDNSIYYNDFVVNSIISCYQDSNSLVIYLSDHALDLFQTDCDYAGHAKANKESTKVGVEIPFWIYVSPKFKKNNPQMVERINNSRNKPFMTDDLIYVIMDIMGVEFKDNPNKVSEHSFLSIKYKNRIRIINGFNIDN